MKVLWEGLPIDEAPDRIRRPGEFFTRLVAVNVSNVGNMATVEPLYVPLMRVQRRAGQVFIEINGTSGRPLVYITLQRRRPFISIFRFRWDEHDPL